MDSTSCDFWRMVAEQNVTLIVTTCRLKEGGRAKCAKFWPEEGDDKEFAALLGVEGMTVTQTKCENLADS
jgi:protein tyrosine phosphatase